MDEADRGEVDWARLIAGNTLSRVRRDREARDQHAARARAAARRLAARLAEEPGVRRVILFGSLAGEGGLVHPRSDIDLAVEGLPAEREAAIASLLADLAGLPLDLVRLEDAAPGLRDRIEETGEVLHVAA